MKTTYIFCALLIVLLPDWVMGQDGSVVTPSAYSTGTNNYIRNWVAVKPDTADANFTTSSALQHSRITTQYFDGLGRPVQTVTKQGSYATGGSAADLVSSTIYDDHGRVERQYLPFAANSTGGNTSISDGLFKTNPFAQQQYFYSNSNSASPVYGQGETYYYGKTEYETSPLSRVQRTYAPGNSWVHDGKGINIKYRTNTVTDSVRSWTVTNSGNVGTFGSYTTSGRYPAGQLVKTITIDENGKQVIEFKDREGKVLLKKLQWTATADDSTGRGHYGWYCTYYIYDNIGLLRCVVQPKGVELLLANSWSMTWNSSVILNEQCFRYEYDGKRRLQMKKMPGAGEAYLVYDARDRLVLMQDANLRQVKHQWLFTQYDSLNRPVVTGTITDPSNYNNLNYHSLLAAASTAYPDPASYTNEVLTRTFYDNYNWVSTHGYLISGSRISSYDTCLLPAGLSWPYAEAVTQSSQVKGLVTGVVNNILGTPYSLGTVYIYDDKGRLIQTQCNNISGALDVTTMQYSFDGKPLVVVNKHAFGSTQTHITVTKLAYDDLNRLDTIKKTITSKVDAQITSKPEQVIAVYAYDGLGQLKQKKLGNKPGAGTPLVNVDYDYNIRGWLLAINKNYVGNSNSDQYFAMELGYDKNASLGTFAHEYNGNISGVIWKSEGDQQRRKYDFSYDSVNRLTGADFNQYVSGSGASATFNKSAGIDFSVSGLTYDANGNILTQLQKGWKLSGSATIDSLSYNYIPHSNRLLNVIDGQNDAGTKLGDFRTSTLHPYSGSKTSTTTDYSYDDNGNMVKDLNKDLVTYGGADGIEYNYLNLPAKITVKKDAGSNKGTIEYLYDAAGHKLSKTVTEGATVTSTLYIAGYEYRNNILQQTPHEEGRIRLVPVDSAVCTPQPARFVYDYFIEDHLGNVRMVLTGQKEDICYPSATVEDGRYQQEDNYFDIANGRRIDKTTTGATQSSFENKLYRVHGGLTGEKTGLGITLKVMAGDTVRLAAESYYTMPGGGAGSPITMAVSELLAAMTGSGAIVASKGTLSTGDISGIGSNNTNLGNFIANNNPGSNNAKAFLCYVLFNEQLQYISAGADPVQVGGGYKLHDYFINNPIPVTRSGYIYIYVSNESNFPVYFDNLAVTHTPGPILEESHYYPFGLLMAGISAKAAGKLPNRFKFNGKEEQRQEFADGTGLDWIDYGARMYDAQIGRWHVVDPKANMYYSVTPYNYVFNNPISYLDPNGMEVLNAHDKELDERRKKMLEADEKYQKIAGVNKGLSKKELKSKGLFKGELKEAYKEKENTWSDFAETNKLQFDAQQDIAEYKANDPKGFKELNELKDNKDRKIDVYIGRKDIGWGNYGKTYWEYNEEFGQITTVQNNKIVPNAFSIYINVETINVGEVLAHEKGHIVDIVKNPSGYWVDKSIWSNLDCQLWENRSNKYVSPAKDSEADYRKNSSDSYKRASYNPPIH